MKKLLFFLSFYFLLSTLAAQTISSKQKSLNAYIDATNELTENSYRAMLCLQKYFENTKNSQQNFATFTSCAQSISSYFLENAIQESNALPNEISANLNDGIKALFQEYETIVENCQTLEAYTKLGDYKTDKFAKAYQLIENIQNIFVMLKRDVENFVEEINLQANKIAPIPNNSATGLANEFMQYVVLQEKTLLDNFFLNYNSQLFTGQFPANKLQQFVNEIDNKISKYQTISSLTYPSSSYYSSFCHSVKPDMQEMKRNLINGYTAKAQQDDNYANSAYLSLINYFHSLISFQHSFTNSITGTSNFIIPKTAEYFPVFRLEVSIAKIQNTSYHFEETPIPQIKVKLQNQFLTENVANSLNNYISFINQSLRINQNLPKILQELNTDCNYKSEQGCYVLKTKNLYFYPLSDYYIPVAEYEKAKNESKYLPKYFSEILNTQSDELLLILREIDLHLSDLVKHIEIKEYKNDCAQHIYEVLKRMEILWENFDKRKEALYKNLVAVYNSYKANEPQNSWVLSGETLWNISEEYKKEMFSFADFSKGLSDKYSYPDTLKILHREATYDKYKNLKNLHELGKSNGHCPFNKYDDILSSAKTHFERLEQNKKELENKEKLNKNYNDYYLYHYNDLAEDYNDFTEIANGSASGYYDIDKYNPSGKKVNYVFLLKQVREPALFQLKEPQSLPKPEIPKTEPTSNNTDKEDLFETMEGFADNNLVFLLDISASMNQPDKLPLLKQSLKRLLTIMRASDKISIVAFSDKAEILLPPTPSTNSKIIDVLNSLKSHGGTKIEKGLTEAYKTANLSFLNDGNNRIILATDGEFYVSEISKNLVEKNAINEIVLTVFSYGRKSHSPNLEKLTKSGKGNYEIINAENTDIKLVMEAKAKKKAK